ncbi:hypothetical protein FRX31_020770 [Thalictrum thalictroides]|uniref:Uncharacterized protein n=1 Tax=Thalictrum thalictroides TaxID=46969 RepID=A0A7J6VXT4_THATH|nr:hypothetical protein FRX31_020770 [Thalictrum thalictroides]
MWISSHSATEPIGIGYILRSSDGDFILTPNQCGSVGMQPQQNLQSAKAYSQQQDGPSTNN